MRALLRLLVIAVLAVAGLTAVPPPVACACSCKGFTTSEAVAAASVVFGGEVISTTEPSSLASGDPVYYRIRMNRVYKGELPEHVVVSSAAGEPSCGIRLAGKVTVFATGTADALETNLCAAPDQAGRQNSRGGSSSQCSAALGWPLRDDALARPVARAGR